MPIDIHLNLNKAMVEVVRISEPGVCEGGGVEGIVQIHTTDPIYLQGMLNFKSKYIHARVQTKYCTACNVLR